MIKFGSMVSAEMFEKIVDDRHWTAIDNKSSNMCSGELKHSPWHLLIMVFLFQAEIFFKVEITYFVFKINIVMGS